MNITSPAFKDGEMIPHLYAKSGENKNPPLRIDHVPTNARALALIVDDPDAPRGTFTHWIVFNIEPSTTEIREGTVPSGAMQGMNSRDEAKYMGPSPPSGVHRYYFRLFALERRIDASVGATRTEVEQAMKGHIITMAELMGRYAAAAG